MTEVMSVVAAANKYLSDMEPWKLKHHRPGPDGVGAARRAAGRGRREDDADAVPAVLVDEGAPRARARRATGRGCRTSSRWTSRRRWARRATACSPATTTPGARWESVPIPVGHADRAADADLHQARPVRRRRGAGQAGRRGMTADSPVAEPLRAPVFDAHTHLDAMAQRAGVAADDAFVAAALARRAGRRRRPRHHGRRHDGVLALVRRRRARASGRVRRRGRPSHRDRAA